MNITILFVEFILIGIGTAIWCILLLMTFFDYTCDFQTLLQNKLFFFTLVTITYVIGILIDRTMYALMRTWLERKIEKHIFHSEFIDEIRTILPHVTEENLSMNIEKFIRYHSDALGKKIDYNLIRYTICRSWIVHFFFIAISFIIWQIHTPQNLQQPITYTVLIIASLFILATVTSFVTYNLAVDRTKDLMESFRIIRLQKNTVTEN